MTKRASCNLWLTEKLWLLHYFHNMRLLNKKPEFISKSGHETKLLISSIKYFIKEREFNDISK